MELQRLYCYYCKSYEMFINYSSTKNTLFFRCMTCGHTLTVVDEREEV